MSRQALLEHVAKGSLKKVPPQLKAGQTVRVSQKIREGGKERVQMFEGLVIAINNGKGIGGTFTVRKIVSNIGVEKIFPLHGATVTKVQVMKEGNVHRAKLYYMRNLRGKAARLKGTNLEDVVFDEEAARKAVEEQEKAVEEAAKKEEDTRKAEAAEKEEKPAGKAEEAKKAEAEQQIAGQPDSEIKGDEG